MPDVALFIIPFYYALAYHFLNCWLSFLLLLLVLYALVSVPFSIIILSKPVYTRNGEKL